VKSTFNYHPILDLTTKSNLALTVFTRRKTDSKWLAGLQRHEKLDCADDSRARIFAPLSQSCEYFIENYYARHNRCLGEMPGQAGVIAADSTSNFKVHVMKFKQNLQTLSRHCILLYCGDFKSFDLFPDLVSEAGRADAVYDAMIERERKRDYLGGFIFIFVWN
jgi:hypothetical protein